MYLSDSFDIYVSVAVGVDSLGSEYSYAWCKKVETEFRWSSSGVSRNIHSSVSENSSTSSRFNSPSLSTSWISKKSLIWSFRSPFTIEATPTMASYRIKGRSGSVHMLQRNGWFYYYLKTDCPRMRYVKQIEESPQEWSTHLELSFAFWFKVLAVQFRPVCKWPEKSSKCRQVHTRRIGAWWRSRRW